MMAAAVVRSAREQSAAGLDIGPLRNRTVKAGLVRNPNPESGTVEMSAEMLATVCFDEAAIASALSNKAIALTVGVSDSIVARWRSVEHKDLPSLVHLHKLGPEFMRLWFRGYSRRHGWGRKALIDLVAAVGEAVAEVE